MNIAAFLRLSLRQSAVLFWHEFENRCYRAVIGRRVISKWYNTSIPWYGRSVDDGNIAKFPKIG